MCSEKFVRPWGFYQVLHFGANFKVKKLCVYPGQRTSLQYHNHRNEHWVVVEGSGECIIDNNINIISPNVCAYIAIKSSHRIINNGDQDLIIIETQTGRCIEEDIIRLEDDYGRTIKE